MRTREEESERKKNESEKEIGSKRDGDQRGEEELCCRWRERYLMGAERKTN